MNKHTPGPWMVLEPGSYALDDLINVDARDWCVYADSFGNTVHHIAKGVEKSNAVLIARAPALLEALKDMLHFTGDKIAEFGGALAISRAEAILYEIEREENEQD